MTEHAQTDYSEKNARDEGWLPVGECTIEHLRSCHCSTDVLLSVFEHGQPEFFNPIMGEFANADSWSALVEQQCVDIKY